MNGILVPSTPQPAPPLDPWTMARWYALYTRSRHEKFVREELDKKGIKTFLPLRQITRHWSDRKKMIEEPLFKGYLFVHAPLNDRFTILNTKGVVQFVGKNSGPVEVPEKELTAVKNFLEQNVLLDPFPYLKEGQRVYMRSGPFKGVEGFIVRKDRHCRLVISLDVLMQSISMIVDEADVEPI